MTIRTLTSELLKSQTIEHSNPTNHFGVGDFDGDGADDLFLTTGAAWYYSPAAKAEWRFLSSKKDTIDF